MAGYRIAADIGGTFTDIACLSPDGTLTTAKVPTTPGDYARAILAGIADVAARLGLQPADFAEILHASTIATNAILEGKGARTALVTTEGFRDVLEMRRIRVPRLYDPLYQKPAPLSPRRLRLEVPERMGPRGEVIRPLDTGALVQVAQALGQAGVDAVAVCFLHSYANPAHEAKALQILKEVLPPETFLCASHEVLPEIREYERTSTTVVNAYIGPVVSAYLGALQERLIAAGLDGRLLMMQSSGGLLDVAQVIARPATVVESGPAAGVVGAARLGGGAGHGHVITFDMGGTTAKASLIEHGRLATTDEYEVGGGISMSSALAKGGGYALKLPVIDVSEVGAGGGSVVRVDAGGALKVGPESAGAVPGPACYAAGGTQATVTDANVVLGYLNPVALAGGTVPIDASLSRAAIDAAVCQHLDCTLEEAAWGIHRLANAAMMRAVKAVSTYRGRDPRDFALFAFGGNGGIHAAALARELGMAQVIVPPGAGVFSAVGLLFTDHEVSRSAALGRPLADDAETLAAITRALARLDADVRTELGAHPALTLRGRADLRYHGQGFELGVDLPPGAITPAWIEALRTAFEAEHRRSYGHDLGPHRIDLVTLRAIGTIPPQGPAAIAPAVAQTPAPAPETTRACWFGPEHGRIATPVIDRTALRLEPRAGPLIVEEYEGTTVVPPDATAQRDTAGNIVITLGAGATHVA
ncbi:hydantoinase/oxoprolinase family protein [Novosphingobium pokkalii]|nr:hydantoinase/oxoprolinase family protein [Novosphingobium pokkalii]GHC89354.1 methylhydantoinase [Novosphingobium pokkalii]